MGGALIYVLVVDNIYIYIYIVTQHFVQLC